MTDYELTAIFVRLLELYTVPEAIRWLASPHKQLRDAGPLGCSAEEVNAVIDRLFSGAFV